jgi:sterol desaturase/sphingolipid hydroxylase (fatty acid hydroxylase superfamily)
MIDLLAQEPWIRLGVFASVFLVMAAWELLAPRRRPTLYKPYRWINNLGIVVLDTITVRVLFPTAAVGASMLAAQAGWGLFNVLPIQSGWAIAISVVLLDLAIWAQHVAFHAVPVLWRLHRMHHADVDFDVTTGLRFHPLEIVLSMLIKIMIVVAFGIPPIAVLVFELLLNASSLFNHGNVRMPRALDAALRWLIVTPDMHRVHHSWDMIETNTNFGFNLSLWDRLFRTYRRDAKDGQEQMTIGLHEFRAAGDQRLDRLLLQPFVDTR